MTIDSRISKKEYSLFMTINLLKTPYMILIIILGLAFIISFLENPEFGEFYLFLGLGFLGLPILTFFTIGQAYEKNKHFSENVKLVFGNDALELVGQTFFSSFTWEQITKSKESDKYFSFFQGRVLVSLLSKKEMNQELVVQLRQLLKDKRKL